ncbi:MAG TPA: hypothetical protein VEB19_07800, partial [Gemmatimonadaceae bacterium]|nr:hypothetical protein [Gemmatimonadaceae bacterium]
MQRVVGWIGCLMLAVAACGDGSTPPDRQGPCGDRLTLDIAEVVLVDADAECLQLSSEAGEYVLAYLDPAFIEAARHNHPDYGPTSETFDVEVSLVAPGASAAARLAPSALQQPVSHLRDTRLSAVDAEPWVIGDTLRHAFDQGVAPELMQVVAIHEDYFVVAVPRADTALFAPWEARLREVFDLYLNEADHVLNTMFGGTRPTSNSDGQFLVLAKVDPGLAGAAYPDRLQMLIGTSQFVTTVQQYLLLAHEMTHVKQFQYSFPRPAESQTAWTQWAVEGGAKFMEGELLRRHVGLELLSNWEGWRTPTSDPFLNAYRQVAGDFSSGTVSMGYGPGAAVIRDFVQRLVVHGMTVDAAARLVLRSSLHGWFGCWGFENCTTDGLAPQMTAALGAPFDPITAVLRVAASAAADDQTSNPELQQSSFFDLAGPRNNNG